jgi:hypothetical protein
VELTKVDSYFIMSGNRKPPQVKDLPAPRNPPGNINTAVASSLGGGFGPQTGSFMSLFQNDASQTSTSDLDTALVPILLQMLEYSNKAGKGQMAYTLMAQFIKDIQGHWAASAAITEADRLVKSQDVYLATVAATVIAAWSRNPEEATVGSYQLICTVN